MIDPIHALAFSIQANRGVYAVLLGSGISRSAKIPTGWDITLDLIRKLANVVGQECEPSPEEWYRASSGKDADYSQLLDSLAKTPAERQQLLRKYWEATPAEREDGAKAPTQAHRAVADLVAQGFVKVIITTNFDRLMETALADVGITPTVLSTPDQMQGALPLIHAKCCLFKIHGDYLDTRIRNTPNELETYPVEFDSLLDRIFDEFGLIVCGWSADWDEALRRAICRAPSRRFATYWCARGEPSQAAMTLINHRAAQIISIKDADSFFLTVQQHVQSLEQFSRPHPLSTEVAVASLKRYLSEPKYRIQLTDLISDEVERVVTMTGGPKFSGQGGPSPDSITMTARIRAYEAACDTLIAMAVQGGYWAESPHYQEWQRALSTLSIQRAEGGFNVWRDMQRFPATLLLYALGIGAIEAGRLEFLGTMLGTTIARENREDLPAVQLLAPVSLFSGVDVPRMLEGMERRHAPLNDWLHATLRTFTKRLIQSDARYTLVFDKLEIIIALGYGNKAIRTKEFYWIPPGAFGYRHDNRMHVLKEIEDSISRLGNNSPYVTSNIVGADVGKCQANLAGFNEFMGRVSGQWE